MEIKVTLRAGNRITLPEAVVRWLGITPGDRLIVWVHEDEPGVVRMRPLRRTYAGTAAGVYGTSEEVRAYIQGERAAW